MSPKTHIFRCLRLALLLSVEGFGASAGHATQFQSVLKNPEAYQHKHVSIVGVVRGNGPTFELFRDAASARSVAPASESILVVAPTGWKGKQPYAMRLVRVTGTVEAREHGFWGNPCGINLEKIEVLSEGPALRPDHAIAVIHNESPTPYLIRTRSADVAANLTIAPSGFLELPRFDGIVKLFGPNDSLVSERRLEISRKASNFDSERMIFYYRIADAKMENVSPSVARKWTWRR